MSRRGGKRPGAGRPQGRKNKATAEQKLTLEELARSHTETALNVLIEVAQHGQSDAARVSAANAILDRGYGKPRQLEQEAASQTKAVYDPEKAAKEHAEFEKLIDEMIADSKAKSEQRALASSCPAGSSNTSQWPGWVQG